MGPHRVCIGGYDQTQLNFAREIKPAAFSSERAMAILSLVVVMTVLIAGFMELRRGKTLTEKAGVLMFIAFTHLILVSHDY